MIRIVLAFLLLSACTAAKPEDLTATYLREGQPALTVRAAANGDAHVEAGETIFLRKDDKEYVVLHDSVGSFAATIDDAVAVFGEDQRNILGAARVQPEYALSEAGSETVADSKGALWKGHPRDVPSFTSFEAVVSSDPALVPLGRALAMQIRFTVLRNTADLGGAGNFEKAMLDLFAKGAVLRFNQVLRLERIDRAPIPATTFVLSQPLLGRDALRTRLRQPSKE